MIKKISLYFPLLLLSFTLSASPIDIKKAEQAARNFFYHVAEQAEAGIITAVGQAYTGNGTIAYYVFGNNNGFVIVSADDLVTPILGYSLESKFIPDSLPENMRFFLAEYVREIEAILRSEDIDGSATMLQWEKILSNNFAPRSDRGVGPLVTSIWGQSPFYNSHCPVDASSSNGHALTGCVATAMSQIIRFWAYPMSGKGAYSYSGNYGILSADFGNTVYQYHLMPDYLASTAPSDETNAIALLNYHCGVAVEMVYGPRTSGAISLGAHPSAEAAFKNFFCYTKAQGYSRNIGFTDQSWSDSVKRQLQLGRPVYYAANDPDRGGHAFICDGYDEYDLFHFNWGWNGSRNGYFQINNLNPGAYAFTSGHRMIMNIYPEPVIHSSRNSLFFHSNSTEPSPGQKAVIIGEYLTQGIEASTTLPFQLSTDSISWGLHTSLTSGDTLFIRYLPTTTDTDQGYVAVHSDGADTLYIALNGTRCDAISQFPWEEGFEDGERPSCWVEEYMLGNTSWTYRNGGQGGANPSQTHSGSYNALFFYNEIYDYVNTTKLVSPPLDITGIHHPMLYFWHTQTNWNRGGQFLKVYYKTSVSSPWQLLEEFPSHIGTWQLDSVSLPEASAEYYIAFEGRSNQDGYGVCLDDIKVDGQLLISATAGTGGSISPPGSVWVHRGTEQTFHITPDDDFAVSEVKVDGINIGDTNQYTFYNVNENHVIEAFFSYQGVPFISSDRDTLFFSTDVGSESAIQTIGITSLGVNDSLTVTATPPFIISTDNDWSYAVKLPASGGTVFVRYDPLSTGNHERILTISSDGVSDKDIFLSGTALPVSFNIQASASLGGTITPEGSIPVQWGDSVVFHFTPFTDFDIADVLVDNSSIGMATEYTFRNIISDHRIEVRFQRNLNPAILVSDTAALYFISEAGSPSDEQSITLVAWQLHDSMRVQVTPPFEVQKEGNWGVTHSFAEDTLALALRYTPANTGIDEGMLTISSQNATPIQIRLAGEATQKMFTISVGYSSGGIITPSNDTTVVEGSTVRFSLIPDERYALSYLSVDQERVDSTTSFTFRDIRQHHSLYAFFEEISSTHEWETESSITIFPNPARHSIRLSSLLPEQKLYYTIYQTNGNEVKRGFLTSFEEEIDISGLQHGFYVIRITTNTQTWIGKFAKI